MTITDADIQCATAALGRAEIFDDRVTADKHRIRAWAEALAPFGFDTPTILAAITAHYQRPGVDTPKPGDVIAAARKIRAEAAEREKGTQIGGAIAAPDPQLGGLPIGGANGEPVWAAYDQWDAAKLTCPHCGAEPDHACRNPITDGPRKIPCAARSRAGYLAAGGSGSGGRHYE